MEKTVRVQHPNDGLCTKVDHPLAGILRQRARRGRVGPDAVEPFHRQHESARILSVNFWKTNFRDVAEVQCELLGVVRLQPEVHFAESVFGKLVEDAFRLEAREKHLQERAEETQQARVALQGDVDVWFDDLQNHIVAANGLGAVDLPDGCAPNRRRIDPVEHLINGAAEPLGHAIEVILERHHGEAIQEILELLRDEVGEDVLAQRQHLPELDVGGAKEFEAAA